jgi:hypothetical protein
LQPEDRPLVFTEDGAALLVARRSLPIEITRVDLRSGARTPFLTLAGSDNAGVRLAVPTITANGKYWALSTARLFTDLYVVQGLR